MMLPENATKLEYQQFLNETIEIFRLQSKDEDDELSRIILDQLLDLKENVVDLGVLTEWDEINERYTLGELAIKNFDVDDELGLRIQDVFYGALDYNEMH